MKNSYRLLTTPKPRDVVFKKVNNVLFFTDWLPLEVQIAVRVAQNAWKNLCHVLVCAVYLCLQSNCVWMGRFVELCAKKSKTYLELLGPFYDYPYSLLQQTPSFFKLGTSSHNINFRLYSISYIVVTKNEKMNNLYPASEWAIQNLNHIHITFVKTLKGLEKYEDACKWRDFAQNDF